ATHKVHQRLCKFKVCSLTNHRIHKHFCSENHIERLTQPKAANKHDITAQVPQLARIFSNRTDKYGEDSSDEQAKSRRPCNTKTKGDESNQSTHQQDASFTRYFCTNIHIDDTAGYSTHAVCEKECYRGTAQQCHSHQHNGKKQH